MYNQKIYIKKLPYIIIFLTILSCAQFDFNNPNDKYNIDYTSPIISTTKGKPGSVEIKWTATQKNIDKFIIYRGIDKEKMTVISHVPGNERLYIDDNFNKIENNKYFYAVKSILYENVDSYLSNIETGYIFHTLTGINDFGLESAVRDAIGKHGSELYAGDLLWLTSLDASSRNIFNIEGIEYLISLKNIDLNDNNITDINPLSSVFTLEKLNLSGNEIEVIPLLSSLSGLKELNLNNNKISDITNIASLSGLTHLELRSNNLIDIKHISSLTELTYLQLNNNNIIDIKALSSLTELKNLYLNLNQIENIKPVNKLENLEILYLMENNITDITAVSSLKKLNSIYLNNNKINNITPILSLTETKTFYLSNNNISDISLLVDNYEDFRFDFFLFADNPLNSDSINIHIPTLRSMGVRIGY